MFLRCFFFFYCSLFGFFSISFAQNSSAIRGLLERKKNLNDTAKVNILNQLSWAYRNSSIDSALYFSEEAWQLALKLNYWSGQATCANYRGIIYRNQGNYVKALGYYFESLRLAEKTNDKIQQGYAYNNIGNLYDITGDYKQAEEYMLKGLEVFKALNDVTGKAYCFHNLGKMYSNEKEYTKALDYHRKALDIRRKLKSGSGMVGSLNAIGAVYSTLKEFDKAMEYFKQSMEIAQERNDTKGKIYILNQMAIIYQQKRELDRAIAHAEQSLRLARSIEAREDIKDAMFHLYELHLLQRNLEQAIQYQSMYVAYQDTLHNEKNNKKIALIYAEQAMEKKQIEIELLEQEHKFHYLVQGVLAGSLMLASLFTLILLRINGEKQKANKELNRQKIEVTHQAAIVRQVNHEVREKQILLEKNNRNIMASLYYAKRIQDAMLPRPDQIRASFSDYFIFFKPRDIVSGDFYWFAAKGKKAIFAAVDCTGHGVPGAFMSMIGDSLLNHIVHDKEIHRPDLILNEMHRGIRNSLKQYESEVNDGMDAAICQVDFERKVLDYAGAKNPIYYIQVPDKHKGDTSNFHEIKGSIYPIGGKQAEKERFFNLHTIPLAFEGQTTATYFYLFSDGYQDQFGGPKGKKFLIKNFKELLISTHHLGMNAQHEALVNRLGDWMGLEHEQIDDIMVAGVKIVF
jgi:tetratricopeptide (TPR) repeat protein